MVAGIGGTSSCDCPQARGLTRRPALLAGGSDAPMILEQIAAPAGCSFGPCTRALAALDRHHVPCGSRGAAPRHVVLSCNGGADMSTIAYDENPKADFSSPPDLNFVLFRILRASPSDWRGPNA